MKYLFLLAFIAAFSFASAQKGDIFYLQKQIKKKLGKNVTTNHQFSIPIPPQEDVAYTLPDGNKIYQLPQDNMPCIMPDMNQFNMPCIKPKKQHYNIPILGNNSKEIVYRKIASKKRDHRFE